MSLYRTIPEADSRSLINSEGTETRGGHSCNPAAELGNPSIACRSGYLGPPEAPAPAVEDSASESTAARPGRPPVFPESERAAFVAAHCPNVTSRRGQSDHLYAARALEALSPGGAFDPACRWLHNPAKGVHRHGLLAELGRIDDDDDLRSLAESLCKSKPKTKAGAANVRRQRLGLRDTATARGMYNAMVKGLNAYAAVHSGNTTRKMLGAVFGLRQSIIKNDPRRRTKEQSP